MACLSTNAAAFGVMSSVFRYETQDLIGQPLLWNENFAGNSQSFRIGRSMDNRSACTPVSR